MRIITIKDEQDISAIVPQVFSLSGSATNAVSRAALQALVEANPQLAGRAKIPAGTPIVVPDHPDIPNKEPDNTFVSIGPLTSLQAQVQEALAFARSSFESAAEAAAQETKESLAVLTSREFKAAAKNLEATALRDQINRAAKDARDQTTQDLKALQTLNGQFDEFTKALAPETGPSTQHLPS